MKKLVIALVLLMAMVPMFAAAPISGSSITGPATLDVQTIVNNIYLYGFSATDLSNTPYNDVLDTSLISAVQTIKSGQANTFYAVVKTNSAQKVSVSLTHGNLTDQKTNNTIDLTLSGTAAGTPYEVIKSTDDTATGARVLSKPFTLDFDSSNAPAGTYTATVTMTVTSV